MFARLVLTAAIAAAGAPARLHGAIIRASREADGTIRVVAEGSFETTFTKRKGFVGTWHDLKHDPNRRHDLAPVADENGILWTKTRGGELTGDGSWYANPPEKMELLEAGPVRVRVRLSGWHRRYGKTRPEDAWKRLGFEQTFTVYPTGAVYVDYALIAAAPVADLHHFLLIIKSTGAWGKEGKGPARGEAHCAGLHGEKKPARWAKTLTPFALQWTDGPTCFQDILMVMYRGIYEGSYWDEGFRENDYRAGLNLTSRWPDKTLPAGRDHIRLLMRFACDLNSPAAASPYAEDYRSPDRPALAVGRLVTDDEGDRDADGFNEAEGCYVVEPAGGAAELTLHGAKTPRFEPILKIKQWQAAAPERITCGKQSLLAGRDFNASVSGGVLLLQLLRPIRDDARIVIGPGAHKAGNGGRTGGRRPLASGGSP